MRHVIWYIFYERNTSVRDYFRWLCLKYIPLVQSSTLRVQPVLKQLAAGKQGSLDFQNEGLLQFQRQRGEGETCCLPWSQLYWQRLWGSVHMYLEAAWSALVLSSVLKGRYFHIWNSSRNVYRNDLRVDVVKFEVNFPEIKLPTKIICANDQSNCNERKLYKDKLNSWRGIFAYFNEMKQLILAKPKNSTYLTEKDRLPLTFRGNTDHPPSLFLVFLTDLSRLADNSRWVRAVGGGVTRPPSWLVLPTWSFYVLLSPWPGCQGKEWGRAGFLLTWPLGEGWGGSPTYLARGLGPHTHAPALKKMTDTCMKTLRFLVQRIWLVVVQIQLSEVVSFHGNLFSFKHW